MPLSTLEPSLIFKDCKQLRLVEDDRQVTTRWWDQTVDTVFCSVEERSQFSFHRYDLKEANRQLLLSTPGIAGNNYFDLSPDLRSLIIGYQDLGHITDYQYHLVTVDVKSGQVREIVLNQKPQVI